MPLLSNPGDSQNVWTALFLPQGNQTHALVVATNLPKVCIASMRVFSFPRVLGLLYLLNNLFYHMKNPVFKEAQERHVQIVHFRPKPKKPQDCTQSVSKGN